METPQKDREIDYFNKIKQEIEKIHQIEKDKKTLEEAVKTIRRTPYYGFNQNIDFEYPRAYELVSQADIKIKLKELRFETYKKSKDKFCKIYVELTNGSREIKAKDY